MELEELTEELNYYITVIGAFKPTIIYDGIIYARLDKKLSKKLSDEAYLEIFSDLENHISNLKSIKDYVEVLKFTIDENTIWSKNLNIDKPISIHIVINATNENAEDILASGIKIQQLLNDMNY